MTPEEMVQRIDETRATIAELRRAGSNPAVERCLQLADMNLHWCRWQLGYTDSLLPEQEEVSGR